MASSGRFAETPASGREGDVPTPIVLKLYVAGSGPCSVRAIRNVRRLCEEHLRGRVDLSIVDIFQQPARAREADLIAAPTLVREQPRPRRYFIGALTDLSGVLADLLLPGEEVPA